MIRLLGVVVVLALSAVPSHGQLLPFTDDFEDGDLTDGMPVTWNNPPFNQIVNGDLIMMGGVINFPQVRDSDHIADVTLRTQVRLLDSIPVGFTDFVGLVARITNFDDAYFGGINQDGTLSVGSCDAIGCESSQQSSNLDPFAKDIVLQLAVHGVDLTLSAMPADNSQPAVEVEYTDTTHFIPNGRIGVYHTGVPDVAVRFFSAIPEPSTLSLSGVLLLPLIAFNRRVQSTS